MTQVKTFLTVFLVGVFSLCAFFPPQGIWSGMGSGGGIIIKDPWDLWTQGVKLRGANIWQRSLFGHDLGLGPGPFGPPYKQSDFDGLSKLGANLVSISHPGIFNEDSPHTLNQDAVKNLDSLIEKAKRAKLFVVISMRTGPGRKEEGFSASIFDSKNHKVWTDRSMQDAWVEMWRTLALRYRDHSNVIGYGLMVEPNGSSVLLKIDSPTEFYPKYAGSLYDWNPLALRITSAIRSVDARTPIILGGMGWSNLEWLSYLPLKHDNRTVYSVHFYDPFQYTSGPLNPNELYPNANFNLFWLRSKIKGIEEFRKKNNVPVMVGEFGVGRWKLGAPDYLNDEFQIFEELKLNTAIWLWETTDPVVTDDEFNYRRGTDPKNHKDLSMNPFTNVLYQYWSNNEIRPLD